MWEEVLIVIFSDCALALRTSEWNMEQLPLAPEDFFWHLFVPKKPFWILLTHYIIFEKQIHENSFTVQL